MFITCELFGVLICLLPTAYSASLSRPRFFTGIFLDAIDDDMIGGSPKDILKENPITWNGLDDYSDENEYYEDFYGNKRRIGHRNKKTLSEDFEDPLGVLLRMQKSQSNFDGDDEEDDVYGYEEDDGDGKKNKKESNENSNEDDDDEEDETDDGYDEEDDDNDNEDDKNEDDDEEDDDEDSEENSESNKKKRKQIVKITDENNEVNKPDAEGNIFIELKDDERVEATVVKIDSEENKKKKTVKKDHSDENNEEDDEDDEEVQEDSDESEEEDDDEDEEGYEERSVNTFLGG